MGKKVCFMDLETQYIGNDFADPKVLRSEGTLGLLGILIPSKNEGDMEAYYYSPDKNSCGASTDMEAMVKLLLKSNRIVGFNSLKFDNPCIEGVIERAVPKEQYVPLIRKLKRKTFDMSIYVRQCGCFKGLDNICTTISDFGKTESSKKIPKMWQRGEHQRVRTYLKRDLKMTLLMYNYGLLYKSILFMAESRSRHYRGTRWKMRRSVSVNFSRSFVLKENPQTKRCFYTKKNKKEVYLPPYSSLKSIFPKGEFNIPEVKIK
jgi:hypothetical protein